MTRPLVLDADQPYSSRGLTDGEWVHSIEPIVVAWTGPSRFWNDLKGEMVNGTSNCHYVEGLLCLGPTWAFLDSTLFVPREVIMGRVFPAHCLTFDCRRNLDKLRPGPLPPAPRCSDVGLPSDRRRRGRPLSDFANSAELIAAYLGPEPAPLRVPRAINLEEN